MTKIEQIKNTFKKSRSKKGLTVNEVCKKTGIPYSTSRRHISRLLERGELDYAEYYKRDSVTGKELTAYVKA